MVVIISLKLLFRDSLILLLSLFLLLFFLHFPSSKYFPLFTDFYLANMCIERNMCQARY